MSTRSLVICVSVSQGNTAAVARALGSALAAPVLEPEDVEPGVLAGCDLVGFGSGIYYGTSHPRLRRFIEQLPPVEGTRAFVFTTSGRGREQQLPWQPSLASLLSAKGYDVVGAFDCLGYDTWWPLRLVGGINKGHPDARDLSHAYEFAARVTGNRPAA